MKAEETLHPLVIFWKVGISLHQWRAWSQNTVKLTQWLIFTAKRALPSSPLFLSSSPSLAPQQQPCPDSYMSWLNFSAGLVFCQVSEFTQFSKDQENHPSHKERSRNTQLGAGEKESREAGGAKAAHSHQQWPLDWLNYVIQRSLRMFHFSANFLTAQQLRYSFTSSEKVLSSWTVFSSAGVPHKS